MPKATQKTNRHMVEDSDEEVEATQTMTQAERALSTASTETQDRRVNDLVQYLLLMDQKKLPIKRQDINKNVLKEFSKAFPVLINRAAEVLDQVFGIKLVEIEGKQKSYILVNNYETDADQQHLNWSDNDNARTALLMIILSLTFMSGNIIQESTLWHALEKLGVEKDKDHEVFGDARKLVTQDFVRQGYLDYLRIQNTDPPQYELKWGQRSKAETSKQNVLDYVCQIYGNMDPQQWSLQYQEIQKELGLPGSSSETDM